jgi:hypothetical protein
VRALAIVETEREGLHRSTRSPILGITAGSRDFLSLVQLKLPVKVV